MQAKFTLKKKEAILLFENLLSVLTENQDKENLCYSTLIPKFVTEDGFYVWKINYERGWNHDENRMDNKSKVTLTIEVLPYDIKDE